MLKTRDRLYGELDLPDEAWRLASSCPVLLRLREIRMANIPFFSYPSFANIDRFEHSLGVAHLAWRWARRNRLADDASLALTLAALYHDGATPALGHLFEEYLFRYEWNHEEALFRLLVGDDQLPGGMQAQIFLDGYCKLGEVLRRSSYARSVSPMLVADIASGGRGVGQLIKAQVDLDNIDNVIRASSAMGLGDGNVSPHPYEVTDALVLEDGKVRVRRDRYQPLAAWASARFALYDQILNNALEFRSQTALKWAIEVCAAEDRELQTAQSWRLTDPELVFEHLRKNPFSRSLIDRVRGARPPELLFSAWVNDLSCLWGARGQQAVSVLVGRLEEAYGMKVYFNYYLDKRQRCIDLPASTEPVLFDAGVTLREASTAPSNAGIVGVVAITRAEYFGSMGMTDRDRAASAGARRDVRLESLRGLLQESLNQQVSRVVPQGWVGARSFTEQLPLFVADE